MGAPHFARETQGQAEDLELFWLPPFSSLSLHFLAHCNLNLPNFTVKHCITCTNRFYGNWGRPKHLNAFHRLRARRGFFFPTVILWLSSGGGTHIVEQNCPELLGNESAADGLTGSCGNTPKTSNEQHLRCQLDFWEVNSLKLMWKIKIKGEVYRVLFILFDRNYHKLGHRWKRREILL